MLANDSTYLGIFLRLFDDLGGVLPEYVVKHARKDANVCKQRVATEGMSFITKTLPALGKHLEQALEVGSFIPFPSIKRDGGRTTPLFLAAMFRKVFTDEGTIRQDPDHIAISAIRQVCYFLYKLESDLSDDLRDDAINSFIAVDESLEDQDFTSERERIILTIARNFMFRIFHDFNPRDIYPRPGPGASASGSDKSKRYEPLVHYNQIHQKFPYYRYFYGGVLHLVDRKRTYLDLPRKEHGRSVMRLVPKDSRGPRIICMEEQEYMFLQQGLADALRDHLENHKLTSAHVNFQCQEINRELARRGSMDGSYATLDMKEASDRISKTLVREIFALVPDLRDCLLALSVPQIELPNGNLMSMQKFAPMGSSLCFPIMSIVHYVLGIACIHLDTGQPTEAIAESLYVYGDDIICRTKDVSSLFNYFPLFGLKFNQGKSFYRGDFRESCGLDAFQGWDVTPRRLKKRFFDGRDPTKILSAIDMANALHSAGYRQTSRILRTTLEHRYGNFPYVGDNSPFLGWKMESPISHDLIDVIKDRTRRNDVLNRYFVTSSDRKEFFLLSPVWDSSLQTMTVSARVLETESDASMLGGWEQLMRSQLDAIKSSGRLDGRFKRQQLAFKRLPLPALTHGASNWLPSVRIRQ